APASRLATAALRCAAGHFHRLGVLVAIAPHVCCKPRDRLFTRTARDNDSNGLVIRGVFVRLTHCFLCCTVCPPAAAPRPTGTVRRVRCAEVRSARADMRQLQLGCQPGGSLQTVAAKRLMWKAP